jgi:hypothetical protein
MAAVAEVLRLVFHSKLRQVLRLWRMAHPCVFCLVPRHPLHAVLKHPLHSRPHRSTRPIAVQSSIFPIHCLLLNPSVLTCYSFPCLPRSRLDAIHPAALIRVVLFALWVVQLLYFQWLRDSCAAMDAPQPVFFQSLADSFHRHGGVPSVSSSHSRPARERARRGRRTFAQQLLYLPHSSFYGVRGKG